MARGGYSFDQIKEMDTTQIQFLHHYQDLVQNEWQQFITNALGLVWDRKTFMDRVVDTDSNKEPLEKIFIPLSLAINPDLLDYVKSQFKITGKGSLIAGGDYKVKPNEVVKPMSELSKTDFLKMLGKKAL